MRRSVRSGSHCRFSLGFFLFCCSCFSVYRIELGAREIWDCSCTECHPLHSSSQGEHSNQMSHLVGICSLSVPNLFIFLPFSVIYELGLWNCFFVRVGLQGKVEKKIWNYSVLFPLISFWSYTHLISGCHCSIWKNFVVIDYDPTYICREKMSKIEKNVFLRDSYLQLMLIYLHLSYNGRRCHQHLYLDLMEQQYRLKIFCMCLQDMAHLTMWESVHIWTFCLFNVRFSTKCLLVQCSSSMLVDVPISINWHLEPE